MHCGASVRGLYSALVFHIHYLFPLVYIPCSSSLIPSSFPPPTVACKTTDGEHLGKRLCRMSNVCRSLFSNITWVCANLRFIVHILCHCSGIVATAAGNNVSNHLEVAWRVASYEDSTSWYKQVYSVGFLFSNLFTSWHCLLKSQSIVHGYLLSTYSCGNRILSAMGYEVRVV